MMRLAMAIAVILVTAVVALAESKCARLRTFSPEERQQFETQYGVNWWKAMGLIPGPETQGDWVDRPAGDSLITVFIPQQFWDLRACAIKSDIFDRREPKRQRE